MSTYQLSPKQAQEIVDRTMSIIHKNVNVMDASGRIIGSGDIDRIGELHEGALLVLSQSRVVEINEATVKSLYGVRSGINLPMKCNGEVVGVIGLTGDPDDLKQYAELLCMSAEMMIEQGRLLNLMAHDSRLREELVLNLITADNITPSLKEWAQRLGIDLNRPRVAIVIEIDSGQLGVETGMKELQLVQTLLVNPEKENLIAIMSLTEIVVLTPAFNANGHWDPEEHRKTLDALLSQMTDIGKLKIRISLGNYFHGNAGIKHSYRTARAVLDVGKSRYPKQRSYFYQDLILPVLLDNLRYGWESEELSRPLQKLKSHDTNGLLIKTLKVWYLNSTNNTLTAKKLFIHRNTLDYRLNKITDICGLDLSNFDDKLLLYISIQLDSSH